MKHDLLESHPVLL